MLAEQGQELEELLAKSLPAAAAVLTHLLDSADEAVRLDAAKALFESWKFLKGSEAQAPVLLPHDRAVLPPLVPPNGSGEKQINDDRVEDLLNEVLGNEEVQESADGEDQDEIIGAASESASAATPSRQAPSKGAPGKSSPAAPPARGGPQEKPAAKTKPKQANDDDAAPKVPRKYWITLGVCALTLGVTWLVSGSGLASPTNLGRKALFADKLEERVTAVVELNSRDAKSALPELRKVLKESKDADVLAAAITGVGVYRDLESVPQLIAEMDNPAFKVRVAAFYAVARVYGESNFTGLEFRESDTAEGREPAKRRAQEIYDQVKESRISVQQAK